MKKRKSAFKNRIKSFFLEVYFAPHLNRIKEDEESYPESKEINPEDRDLKGQSDSTN